MRYTSLLPAFLASTLVSASPDIERILGNLAEDEIHILKRDTVITPRDIELAERDNVDPSQMYRHSIIKRDDGDHITIWVAKNFVEKDVEEHDSSDTDDSDAELDKRQTYRIGSASSWRPNTNDHSFCNLGSGWTSYIGDTGPHAPYTGGANAIINWGYSCRGYWYFVDSAAVPNTYNLVFAGSDAGFNMRFTVQPKYGIQQGDMALFGCRDVGIITHVSRDRFQQQFSGKWRVRARGDTTCKLEGNGCFKNICIPLPGTFGFRWWVDNWDRAVNS